MQATAEIKYIRISDRKLRDLSRNLRGMSAKRALSNLMFTPTKGARLLIKAIESAVANATNTHKMNGDALHILRIEILKGPFFKRWNPVSRGMAHAIKKRTSHIKIVLTDRKNGEKEKETRLHSPERSDGGQGKGEKDLSAQVGTKILSDNKKGEKEIPKKEEAKKEVAKKENKKK
ncbi:50S ribosomal protein L22 [Candidatus Gottesmanbacteria bacterium RIFCSPHIGHO2_02_FULL_39_11]|uniref:Large ribosomal subunit protein uL22 n=1 Tax=Candidatus Gottesmanbacteria bacterium RIFCSPHIGHO2_02_FULL_39_11 TaxID=1798382 RepID=A0A1F5ZXQ8_9BACT|nr:MAG: 50S ribosomal protein L22 [Candidatus Gottesmanbacteria bacterium RIFCSPHIGHO2_02_FULL_39_11]